MTPDPVQAGRNEAAYYRTFAKGNLVGMLVERDLQSDEEDREFFALQAERDELYRLVVEAYPGDAPTNLWRARAERLKAWPAEAKRLARLTGERP